jgi:tape measure domain-containing protein
VVSLTKESLQLAMGFETAKISWGVLLGDMGEGEKMFSKIQALAAKTPLSFESVEQGARTLKQFGLATADILPTIKMLGDVSAGNADKLRGLSVVYGQIMSTGRLMGQDLLQLINQGFNPLTIISKKTGESMAELKKRMEQGGISAQEVADAFKTATSEGGIFYGMMDKTATTASGQLSTAMDNIKMQMADFGDTLLKLVTPALKAFNDEMDRIGGQKNIADTVLGRSTDIDNIRKAMIDIQNEIQGLNKDNFTTYKQYKDTLDILNKSYEILKEKHTTAMAAEKLAEKEAANAEKLATAEAARLKRQKELAAFMDSVNSAANTQYYSDQAMGAIEYAARVQDVAEAERTWYADSTEGAIEHAAALAKVNDELIFYADSTEGAIEHTARMSKETEKILADLRLSEFMRGREALGGAGTSTGIPVPTEKDQDAWDKYIEKLTDASDKTQILVDMAEIFRSEWGDAWEAVGQSLVSGEDGWKSLGKVAVNTISGILEALGKELTIKAIQALLEGNIGGAALAGAGSAAAFAAAGFVKAIPMANGGIVEPRPGGTLARLGEAGSPEMVIPLKGGRNGLGNTYNITVQGSLIRERELWQQVQAVAG